MFTVCHGSIFTVYKVPLREEPGTSGSYACVCVNLRFLSRVSRQVKELSASSCFNCHFRNLSWNGLLLCATERVGGRVEIASSCWHHLLTLHASVLDAPVLTFLTSTRTEHTCSRHVIAAPMWRDGHSCCPNDIYFPIWFYFLLWRHDDCNSRSDSFIGRLTIGLTVFM